MPSKVIFWGAGGHALVCAEILAATREHELVGCLVSAQYKASASPTLAEIGVATPRHLADLRAAGIGGAFVAIGDCPARLRIAETLTQAGFVLISLVHPQAVVSPSATVGPGTVIMPGAIVNAQACIGGNVILNTGCSVDHECQVSDGVHISPGARLAGGVRVGRATWIGLGASVCDRVEIGSHSIVGAGAVVIKQVPDNVVVVGVPSRVIKTINALST